MSVDFRPPRLLLIALLGVAPWLLPAGRAIGLSAELTSKEKDQLRREARLVVDLVQNYHYSGTTFGNISNPEILARYLHGLDLHGDLFPVDEVEFLHRRFDRSLKTVYLFRGDLEPAFEIFDDFYRLANARLKWVSERLGRDFDFTVDETYVESIDDAKPAPRETLDRQWELRLKDDVISAMLAGRTEDEARKYVGRRYAETKRALAQIDSFAVRERFLETALQCFDPHSGYFSADSTRDFATMMEGTVVGVGLDLKRDDGRCIVTAVAPGGPADLHSSITPGDVIEALALGDGPWQETSRQHVRETLALLRGPRGGKVRIAYRSPGAAERAEVTLERDRVVLVGERARGAITEVPAEGGGTKRIGWILLPTFYSGGKGVHATSAAADVRELLEQMLSEKITGLVLDLRTNPGGNVTEAVGLSQLFLPKGVVMLARRTDGQVEPLSLKEETPLYSGPFVVLTSPGSASASEIFAAAMKVHGRGLVVGGEATFGKGSSQNYIDLAKAQRLTGDEVKDWGTLRLTTNRFFAPDGGAIQGTGVTSDVVLPDQTSPHLRRESALPHALPPEHTDVPPGTPPSAPPVLTAEIRHVLESRATHDLDSLAEWKLWSQEAATAAAVAGRNSRSLLLAARQAERKADETTEAASRKLRRELTKQDRYPTHPVEIALVKSAFELHQKKLGDEAGPSGPAERHYQHRAFLVKTDQGQWRTLRLRNFPFTAFLGDAPDLAERLSANLAQPVDEAHVRRTLTELSLLEDETDPLVLGVARDLTTAPLDDAGAQRALDALLSEIVDRDANLTSARLPLDVPLRESLRLAAAWSELASPAAP